MMTNYPSKSRYVALEGAIVYDSQTQTIRTPKTIVALTPSERRIVRRLVEHQGEVVSREQLMLDLWNTSEYIGEGTLTTHISRLRRKLKRQIGCGLIQTVKGKGYKLPKR